MIQEFSSNFSMKTSLVTGELSATFFKTRFQGIPVFNGNGEFEKNCFVNFELEFLSPFLKRTQTWLDNESDCLMLEENRGKYRRLFVPEADQMHNVHLAKTSCSTKWPSPRQISWQFIRDYIVWWKVSKRYRKYFILNLQ